MKNTATIIKIGDSAGVTIPAKQLKNAGLKPGDKINFAFEAADPIPTKDEVLEAYAKFTAQYGETLKNLADR